MRDVRLDEFFIQRRWVISVSLIILLSGWIFWGSDVVLGVAGLNIVALAIILVPSRLIATTDKFKAVIFWLWANGLFLLAHRLESSIQITWLPATLIYILPALIIVEQRVSLRARLWELALLAVLNFSVLYTFVSPLAGVDLLINFMLWCAASVYFIGSTLWAFRSRYLQPFREAECQTAVLNRRLAIVNRVVTQLATAEDFKDSADQIAQILYTHQFGERVLILKHEPDNPDDLKVVAGAGQQTSPALGYALPGDRGVSRRAIKEKRTQIVPDVSKDTDFVDGGLPPRGSELSAPLICRAAGAEQVLGTINIQRDALGAFEAGDVETIEILAEVVAQFAHRDQTYFKFEADLAHQAEAFYACISPKELIGQLLVSVQMLFPDSRACFFRLAGGSGVPLRPAYFVHEFAQPEFFEADRLLRADSDLTRWIKSWSPQFIENLAASNCQSQGSGFGRDFQAAENISALCFLPLGTPDTRVGALVLFFKTRHAFKHPEKMRILAFVREASPHFARLEHLLAVHQGFARPQIQFHHIMNENNLGRGNWEAILDAVLALGTLPAEVRAQVERLRLGLKRFINEVLFSENQLKGLSNVDAGNFREALRDLFAKMEQQYGAGRVISEIDPLVEEENNDIRVTLFTMITEAARNSFVHGEHARQIRVKVSRHRNAINIEVNDDGCGFDPAAIPARSNSHADGIGIFGLDRMAQSLLGATAIDWTGTAPGGGTRLRWSIPALPDQQAVRGTASIFS